MLVCGVSCSSTYWRADREAEGARLLSEYRMQILSGVRIPSSPPDCSGSSHVWGASLSLSLRPSGLLPTQLQHFSRLCLTHPRRRGNISNCTRRYLSWIEDLTTNQGVIGSNPIRRTTQRMRGSLGSPSFFMIITCSERRPKLHATPVSEPNKGVGDPSRVTQIHEIDEGKLPICKIVLKRCPTSLR